MFDQFEYGIRLYLRSFVVLAFVGLPISVPANLLWIYVSYGSDESLGQFRLLGLGQAVVGLFQAGVTITALHHIVVGKQVRLGEALWSGAKYWPAIVATTIVANIIIGLALLAFIIPGIVGAVRYAFIDLVVVLENCHGSAARKRSWELTRDCAWWILLASCVFYPFMVLLGSLPLIASSYVELSTEAWMAIEFVNGCIIDLFTPLMTAILFSFYWHAAGRVVVPEESAPDDELSEIPFEPSEDENPYRAPQAT